MTTVFINENSPQAIPLLNYLESLPFASVEKAAMSAKEHTRPCQCSVEQMRRQIDLSLEDYKTAGVAFTMAEMRAKHPSA